MAPRESLTAAAVGKPSTATRTADRSSSATQTTAGGRSAIARLGQALGNRALNRLLADSRAQEAADWGTRGASTALPHRERIQRSFGRHDVSGVRAYLGPSATRAARAMGASAFASGNRVAFAGGTPDLRTAAHEAVHVVQQRRGVHLKGGVGQVGDVYERHADAVADRVAAGQSAEALLDRYAPRGAVAPVDARHGPVQRLVGFEYEMGDIRTERWGLLRGWHEHAKGAVLGNRAGYQLTADEGVGNSQLEVIIRPIDETNPLQVAQLVGVTGPAIRADINAIAAAADQQWTRADQIAGINGSSYDRYYSDEGNGDQIRGQLQMTGGIALNKLYDHLSGAQANNYLATINPPANADDQAAFTTLDSYTRGAPAAAAQLSANGIVALNGLTQGERDQVAAIAAMMATIAINFRAAGNLPYPKSAAGGHLGRTDFSKILSLLPNVVKSVLTPAIMRQIVLASINGVGLPGPAVVGGDHVIPVGARLAAGNPQYGVLTIDRWVGDATPTPGRFIGYWQGSDLLTKARFPGTRAQREGLESLGGYGNRVDAPNKPIIEFRTLNGVFVDGLSGQLERLIDFLNHP